MEPINRNLEERTMAEADSGTAELVKKVYAFAAEQMRKGLSVPQIEQNLQAHGLDATTAHTVVQNLSSARSKALREHGRKNMIVGGLWCGGGTAVTVLTLQAAQGGGTYVVAWGAILFGAIQFLRGLSQFIAN
jgi:uncharacterized protein YaaW (UPF0174 family)